MHTSRDNANQHTKHSKDCVGYPVTLLCILSNTTQWRHGLELVSLLQISDGRREGVTSMERNSTMDISLASGHHLTSCHDPTREYHYRMRAWYNSEQKASLTIDGSGTSSLVSGGAFTTSTVLP